MTAPCFHPAYVSRNKIARVSKNPLPRLHRKVSLRYLIASQHPAASTAARTLTTASAPLRSQLHSLTLRKWLQNLCLLLWTLTLNHRTCHLRSNTLRGRCRFFQTRPSSLRGDSNLQGRRRLLHLRFARSGSTETRPLAIVRRQFFVVMCHRQCFGHFRCHRRLLGFWRDRVVHIGRLHVGTFLPVSWNSNSYAFRCCQRFRRTCRLVLQSKQRHSRFCRLTCNSRRLFSAIHQLSQSIPARRCRSFLWVSKNLQILQTPLSVGSREERSHHHGLSHLQLRQRCSQTKSTHGLLFLNLFLQLYTAMRGPQRNAGCGLHHNFCRDPFWHSRKNHIVLVEMLLKANRKSRRSHGQNQNIFLSWQSSGCLLSSHSRCFHHRLASPQQRRQVIAGIDKTLSHCSHRSKSWLGRMAKSKRLNQISTQNVDFGQLWSLTIPQRIPHIFCEEMHKGPVVLLLRTRHLLFLKKRRLSQKNYEKLCLNLHGNIHSEIDIEKANFANFSNSFLIIMLKQVITS